VSLETIGYQSIPSTEEDSEFQSSGTYLRFPIIHKKITITGGFLFFSKNSIEMMQGPGRSKPEAEGNDHRNALCPAFLHTVEDIINLPKRDTVVENDKSQMTCVILVDIYLKSCSAVSDAQSHSH